MTIKSSGYTPNNLSSLYSCSSRKLDQTTAVQSKAATEDVDRSCNFKTSNVDTIELSQPQVNNPTGLSKAKDRIISDLNKDSDVSFLETLKAQINSNQYKVDSKEMAKIMLINDK